MPGIVEMTKTIKERLTAQMAPASPSQAEPAAPAGNPAPGRAAQPAPPPLPSPPAAPAPVPAVPSAIPAPPPVDVAALQARLDALQADNQALKADLEAIRTIRSAPVNITLPPKEQLDAMTQGELAEVLAKSIAGHTMAQVEGRMGTLERERIEPLQRNLNATRKVEAESVLRARFPRLDLEKVRPAFEAKLAANRSLSFEDAVRLVADPADLMPGEPARTPASGPVVPIDTGLPVRAAAVPAPANAGPTDAELLQQANTARIAGNSYEHRRLMQELAKRRIPSAPG